MTNEKILLQLEKGYDIKNPQLAQVLKNTDQSLSQEIKDLQENTIRTDISQDFSNAQQDVALSNIGLDFINVDYSLLGTTLDDSMAALIENAKGIILLNSPDNNRPVIWTRGNFSNNYIYFNSWVVWDTVSSIMFNVSTKRLSNISNGQLVPNCIKYDTVQSLTDAQKQQARSNIDAVGSSGIKGVEIVYSTAPMQQDNILYIELEETT